MDLRGATALRPAEDTRRLPAEVDTHLKEEEEEEATRRPPVVASAHRRLSTDSRPEATDRPADSAVRLP